ncbi:unnamed protein product [Alopecurus aequalis]
MPRTVSDDGKDLAGVDISSRTGSHRRTDNTHHEHKVGFPPNKGAFAEFSAGVKETFFADDPLREYKHQPVSKKLWLGLQHFFPILDWGRHYTLGKFKGDLIAGMTIASLCIPQDIGYAKLAGLKPNYGLYTSFVPPLIYALMGSSRDIAIGPVAVVSLLLGTLLQQEIDPVKNPLEYTHLAFTATFFAGVTQFALGFFRLGFIIEFLSHAAIIGFMAGAAVTIALQQLKGFLGIAVFTKKSDIISVMKSVWGNVHHGEAIAIGRTFAGMKDYQIDGNKEMVALGTMNIIGSFTSCYVATGSFSRSAVNYMAGCQTAISNVVMSIVVMLTLLLITPLFKYTPNAILASIIINAVLSLIDFEAAYLIWKVDKMDFVALLGAFFGVVFASVEYGLLIAVAISLAKILLQVTRPRTALLGNLPRTTIYRNVEQYPGATQVPGVLILILANPGAAVIQKLRSSKFTELIGDDKIFLSVGDAVKNVAPKAENV